MKSLITTLLFLLLPLISFAQEVDPDFHIYLCFGQSNMEGMAAIEDQDRDRISERFQMLATTDFEDLNRKLGTWYKAVPPLCRYTSGLSPMVSFGQELTATLPDSIRVGVIMVAILNTAIEVFMDESVKNYLKGVEDWVAWIVNKFYNNDPFGRLVSMGKIGMKSGVIKGIMMHQGENNLDEPDWANKVKIVRDRMCNELGLDPNEIPLLAGEMLYEDQGGCCASHNVTSMPKLTEVMNNAYIISAEGLPGAGDDYHFTAEGYRELGRRYAKKILELEHYTAYDLTITDAHWATLCVPFEFDIPEDVELYSIKSIEARDQSLTIERVSEALPNTPYLAFGSEGTYHLKGEYVPSATTDDGYLCNGLLVGTLKDAQAPVGTHVLQKHDEGVGFYAVNSDKDIPLPANHAYLKTNTPGVSMYLVPTDPSCIDELHHDKTLTNYYYYNMCGQSTRQSYRGVQIMKDENGHYRKCIILP